MDDSPYDAGPFPVYALMRAEAPVDRNPDLEFWELSRHADVSSALTLPTTTPTAVRARGIRLHLDVRVSRGAVGEERWARVTAEAERLVAAGATRVAVFDDHHVVMADPEGNEFCLC
ncbi:VOC family protein [Nonomuraea africana]|uniref:Glyoxalase-like domain-containing protein n=1 Tax=Nonomuraea africana TaxID=46171 RepID=A0ABR9KGV9_9ACTN|nr:VOC family protein [Nonomuraea africana]MBE1561245.1 hypothetical protein [Nonomuraea africana]